MPHIFRSLVITFIFSLLCPARANAILEVYCEDSQGRIFKLPSTEASKYKVYSWKYLFFERDEPSVTENVWGSIQSNSILALTNFKNQNIAIENEIERLTNNVSQTTFKNFLGPIRVLSPVKNFEALNLLVEMDQRRSKMYLSLMSSNKNYLDQLVLLNNAAFDLSKLSLNNYANFPTNTLKNSIYFTRSHETLNKLGSLLAQEVPVNKYPPSVPRYTPAPAPVSPLPKIAPKPAPQVAPLNELPYGIALKDRPGFVQSPFAAPHQLVDVTGLPVGMEVKCPYTGKLFRVPPPFGSR